MEIEEKVRKEGGNNNLPRAPPSASKNEPPTPTKFGTTSLRFSNMPARVFTTINFQYKFKKKFRTLKKVGSSLSKQGEKQHKYGPPALVKMSIHESMGRELGKRPMGLKRHRKSQSGREDEQRRETYFDLTLRVGQLNFLKRFKNLHYLESFSSKKNMHNLCEQRVISEAYRQISQLDQHKRFLYMHSSSLAGQ